MHSIGPDLNSIVGERMMVGSVVLLAFIAFAMLVLVLLVKRFGALRTFGWGVSLFLVGLMSLVALSVKVRTPNVAAYEEASAVSARSHAQLSVESSSGNYATDATIVSERGHGEVVAIAPVRRRIQAEEPAASAWDENIAPVANIYPSIPDCGRPLAAKLVKQLQEEAESKDDSPKAEKEAPAKYRIALQNSGLDKADFLNFLISFRKDFTTAFPGSFVDDMTGGKYPSPKDPDKEKQLQRLYVTVYLTRDGQGRFFKWADQKSSNTIERSGQVVCQLRRNGPMGQMEFTSNFIDKPWVADAEKFVSSRPKQKLIIGFSQRLATSEQEARVSALKDANVRFAKSTNKAFLPHYDMERNVVDRFVQKLTMPYGSVWREAVLVDPSLPDTKFIRFYGDTNQAGRMARGERTTANVGSAHATAAPAASRKARSRAKPESMVAGLMMLTIVVGWISNWMTQGYYRGPVWTVTGTLFSIGFVFLIFVVLKTFA